MTQHEDNTMRTMCTRANHDVNCPCHIRTQEQVFKEEIIYRTCGEIMGDISVNYKVGDRLCDILSDSLAKQIPIVLSLQRQQILSDLIKIANQGEYEDMRREIERYNNL